MIPRYVLFAAPWTALHHKPLLHWYTHRQASPELRLARRLATHILTAAPGSYPLPSPKVAVLGHGVETDLFPLSAEENAPPEVILVARLSRIKRQDWLLRAASRAMIQAGPLRVILAGGAVTEEPDYPTELEALAHGLAPIPDLLLTGPLPRPRLAQVIARAAVAVNLSPPGLFDKAPLETMLSGKPTLVTNRDFLPVLGEAADLLYLPSSADDTMLADRLARLLALTPAERAALGADLRARVADAHSLETLMDRLVQVMREATCPA
jgi:glycosyltransferase involved in cell wall biosynthesis